MPANSSPVRVAFVLLAAAAITPSLDAQYVPIRELDSNHLMTGPHVPKRVVGGIAAGYEAAGSAPAVLWDANGSNLLTPLSGSLQASANGLNSSQVVVGWCQDASFQNIATRWTARVAEDLNGLVTSGAPLFMFDARDIEEHGRIVGAAYNTTTYLSHAFLFDSGTLVDLGSLNGGADSSLAVAVNAHLVAAGESTSAGGATRHAVRFDSSGVLDLHDPTVMGSGPSWSVDITRDGKIAGGYGNLFATRPFLWDGSKVVDLKALIPGRSQILGMNDFGDVVGWYDPIGTGTFFYLNAFLLHHGVFTDLNTIIDPALGWGLGAATDIDNEGRIVGFGFLPSAGDRGYIIEPICKGTFTTYGYGAVGTGGLEPQLRGVGCPAPDHDFALEIVDGYPSVLGFMFLGTGTTSAPATPGCDVQVLPLQAPYLFPFLLDSFGASWNQVLLPAGTPIFDLNLQAIFFDPGAPYGISSTKPLALHFE